MTPDKGPGAGVVEASPMGSEPNGTMTQAQVGVLRHASF